MGTTNKSSPKPAVKLLGEERLNNFLRTAVLQGADPTATWRAEQLSARTFRISCGRGRDRRQWRASFRACGRVQALMPEV
jgi:hypothetical protein